MAALQLMATEDVKSTELNVLQLPVSKDLDAEKADEFVQLVATRYGMPVGQLIFSRTILH